MGSIRDLFSCNCRKRTFMNKILPMMLQIFVVTVVVWQIFKAREQSLESEDGTERNLRSADFTDLPKCSPGDYEKGSSLSLDAIMSHPFVLSSSSGRQQTHFLNVEVIVRDLDQGSMVLYPVGTPVIFTGGKEGNVDTQDGEEYLQEHDQSKDEEGLLLRNSDQNLDIGIDENEDGGIEPDEEKFPDGNQKLVLDYGEKRVEEYQQGGADHNINQMLVNEEMLRIEPEDQRGQQEILNQMEENSDEQGNVNQQLTQQQQNNLNQQNNFLQEGQQSNFIQQGQQGYPNQQFQHDGFNQGQQHVNFNQQRQMQAVANLAANRFGQQSNQNPQYQEGMQNRFDGQQNVQSQQQGASNINLNQPGFQGHQGGAGQQGMLKQSDPVKSILSSGGSFGQRFQRPQGQMPLEGMQHQISDTADARDEEEELYTEGFHDRILKFKGEFFGKIPEDSQVEDKSSGLFRINNPLLCQSLESIDLLYVILVQPQSDEQRQSVRNSFVDSSYFKPFTIVHIFFVGKTTSPSFQNNLNQEQERYHDIVQADFMDVPGNSTLKGLMALKWVDQYCRGVKFVMKVDEDVFVDTGKLLTGLIPAVKKTIGKRAMLCPFNPQSPIPRSGPNALQNHMFPNRTLIRPYCKGYAILMTREAVSSLVAVSDHVPMFPMAELYLYGILPFVAGGVEVYDLGNKRAFHDFGKDVVDCYNEQGDRCPFVASKAFSARFSSLWEIVKSRTQRVHPGWEGTESLWNIPMFKRNF